MQLGFLPLLEAGVVDPDHLIADAKSGVSGAGRKAELHLLFSEASDNFKAYNVPGHRHRPEIRQGLPQAARREVGLVFTPHLTPMIRGIHATLYARITKEADFQELFEKRYASEPFVDVMPAGSHPDTRSVRAAEQLPHRACIAAGGRGSDTLVVLSVIDNLVKGASGQAVQNMNLMFGLPETTGLEQVAGGALDAAGPGRWKLMRQRFGIAAPRVEVQTQIPWYWRWAGIAVLLGVGGRRRSWIYDAGRRFAGFDRSEVLQELQTVRGELERGARRARAAARDRQRRRQPRVDRAHRAADARATGAHRRAGERPPARRARDVRADAGLGRAPHADAGDLSLQGGTATCCQGNTAIACCCSRRPTGAAAISTVGSSWSSACRKGGRML